MERILIVFFLSLVAVKSSASDTIEITAKAKGGVGKNELQFELKNLSADSICMSKSDLPWENGADLIIVPTQSNGVVHEEKLPVNDFEMVDCLQLKKSGSVSGTVDLDNMFPKLKEARIKSDIVIFWTHKVHYSIKNSPEGTAKAPRFGGWVLLPKIEQAQ